MLLLDEDYLLPPGVILPESPGPRNYRFLFPRHVARLLSWIERRGEGEPHGFSHSVNKFIREVWWPDEVAEALYRAGQQNRQSCQTEHLRRRCSCDRTAQRRFFRGALQVFKGTSSRSLSSCACCRVHVGTFRIVETHLRV